MSDEPCAVVNISSTVYIYQFLLVFCWYTMGNLLSVFIGEQNIISTNPWKRGS